MNKYILIVISIFTIECHAQHLVVKQDAAFIETSDGKPFLWLGDTAWELFNSLNKDEIIKYLDNRKSKGFTVIQAAAGPRGLRRLGSSWTGLLALRGQHRRASFLRGTACMRRGASLGFFRRPLWEKPGSKTKFAASCRDAFSRRVRPQSTDSK